MNTTYLTLIAAIGAVLAQPMKAEMHVRSVCDALNSAADRQAIVIHAVIASNRHGTFLVEGTGQDPCPGWRRRFLTAPSAIPLVFGSYSGVHVPDDLSRENMAFILRLKRPAKEDPRTRLVVTARGVLIRKRWPLIFRMADGSYCCWGEGIGGGSASVLVLTSSLVEDR